MKQSLLLIPLSIAILFVDYFWPLPVRRCETNHAISTRDHAKEYAFAHWRANSSRVLFGGMRYLTADDIIQGVIDDGRIEIDQHWDVLNFGYVWYVGASIGKFTPEYYGFGVEFNRCGRIIRYEKVGHG